MEKAVFFNLDGTLTTEVPYQEITEEILLNRGVNEDNIDSWRYYELFFDRFENLDNDPYVAAFADYIQEFDLDLNPQNLGSEYKERELNHVESANGIFEVLDGLKHDYELGIITDGIVDLQERKINKIGVQELFSPILISYRDGGNKEELEIFKVAEEAHEKIDDYLYISHKDKDIASATNAEWKTFQGRIPKVKDASLDF